MLVKKVSLDHVEVALTKYVHANLLHGSKERLLLFAAVLNVCETSQADVG